jgi:hypothetical protein
MRFAVGLLWAITLLTACGEDPSSEGDGDPEVIKSLAQLDASLDDFEVCVAFSGIPDSEQRAAAILGVESVRIEGDTSRSEHSLSGSCEVTSASDPGTYLSIDMTQEPDGSNEVRSGDQEVYQGCFLGHEPFGPDFVFLRCRPGFRVAVGVYGGTGIEAWPGTPRRSTVPAGEPASEYVDLLHDLLVSLSNQG